MKLTKNYLKTAEKDVQDLSKIHKRYWEEPRYQILKKFCHGASKILSVGCGPKEPIIINATHALDLTHLSETYLRKAGWEGEFFVGTCDNLPFNPKSFEIVVCSEVIEHLLTIKDVSKTFKEVARVGKRWIIDTPNSDVIKPKDQNPAHIQFFTLESLKKIIEDNTLFVEGEDYKIYKNDRHLYVESL